MPHNKLLQSLIESFLTECDDILAGIEQSALSLGSGENTQEITNQLFRAFHTIKGSSGMCGLDTVAGFTHHLEDLLVKVREGVMPVTPKLVDLVLKSKDHIKLLMGAEQGQVPPPPEAGDALIAEIQAYGSSGSPAAAIAPAKDSESSDQPNPTATKTWSIRFRPNPGLFANGTDPNSLFKELRELGECQVLAHPEAVPSLDTLQPDLCYLSWTITLTSTCDRNAIKDVFIFVESDCKLDIELTAEIAPLQTEKPVEVLSSLPIPRATQPTTPATPPPTAQPKETAKDSSVRVPSTRLDRLVNLVGELVINQSRLAQAASQNGAAEFTNPVQELERLLAELRDNVLGIRMLPIGTLFGRFRRLVHDLSTELGKEVDLVTEGDDTEMDKSILDQLSEPFLHCLRNSLDHGVETADDRVAKGKPRRATVRLSAVHTGSDVVVSIQDDGRGLDRKAIKEKAVERNLIAPDAILSDKDIFNLILAPGFSTARQVTNVSGRGVGMDAVKRQIDALRGSLSLSSEDGKGTRISITLPLTLAIIDGLLVQVGVDQFIVPMAAVNENVELPLSHRSRNNGRNVIAVRGELIPYIDLRKAFSIAG
jgi:two-component system chemotaxis sensor kinase CheA